MTIDMTLLQIYDTLSEKAFEQPNIHTVESEFTKLNREDTKYSAVIIQQREHSRDYNFMNYNFYLGYVDRLNADKENEIEIHSTGINILNNIINGVREDGYPELDITGNQFITFNQRFTAECAGVYTAIQVSVPIGECEFE